MSSVRGSASRGAVGGFLQLVDAYRRGHDLAVLPGRPARPALRRQARGRPSRQATGAPIFPMTYAATRCVRLRSWDRLIIPLPFARIAIEIGAPLVVSAHADEDQLEHCRGELERALTALTETVDAKAAGRPLSAAVPVP